jgi:hypothetical protein
VQRDGLQWHVDTKFHENPELYYPGGGGGQIHGHGTMYISFIIGGGGCSQVEVGTNPIYQT